VDWPCLVEHHVPQCLPKDREWLIEIRCFHPKGRCLHHCPGHRPAPQDSRAGIDKSLALERKIESRKRNFSLDLENLIVPISLSTLDFREWQETILFLLSIFESGKNKFSFHSRFSRVARQISLSTLVFFSIFESSNREFNIIYSRWFKIDQPISVPEV